MKIRSITYFTNVTLPFSDLQIESAGRFLAKARTAFEDAGYDVQTTRLALPPFGQVVGDDASAAVPLARDLETACFIHSIDYATIGPALLDDSQAHFQIIPSVLRETEQVFTAAEIATRSGHIDLGKLKLVADAIRQNAAIASDGFGNLRFAALAHVPPGVPFLPAAYHDGGEPHFALAIQGADLILDAILGASSLAEALNAIGQQLSEHAAVLAQVARGLGVRFSGIDMTPAPFPEETDSIGAALEALGSPMLGQHGTLAATGILTDAIQQSDLPHTGFSGIFLPLLEDSRLARRGAEGVLSINDLLMYSAVCGTGLDTVPVTGDISQEALSAILLDVAVLAARLSKPLTVRLMPMPGKQAGDELTFNFPYFANGRVLSHNATALTHLLAGVERFRVQPRPIRS